LGFGCITSGLYCMLYTFIKRSNLESSLTVVLLQKHHTILIYNLIYRVLTNENKQLFLKMCDCGLSHLFNKVSCVNFNFPPPSATTCPLILRGPPPSPGCG